MIFAKRAIRIITLAAFASLAGAGTLRLAAQEAAQQPTQQSVPQDRDLALVPLPEASEVALPLPEDRGAAALEQSLKRLSTTASVMMIVAHPDDEDGALLTYLSRGMGVRTILLTLTRGEGGQNAMGEESYDALGLIRTNELLKASEYYGAKQLWGTEADFGFSKTQEESFAKWGHERVLYDAVLAVRRERPQVIVSTFVGGVSDGHGHHQVSGEIAQEVFKAAGDPKVFPEQLKDGLQPWQPLAVYSMVPFAPIKDGKMFDYATGKWAPARFKNYVTGEWIEGAPSADVTIPVGQQKSQNGGANPTLSGPASTSYHLWAVAPQARTRPADYIPLGNPREIPKIDTDLFHNRFVSIDTWIGGMPQLAKAPAPRWLVLGLAEIGGNLRDLLAERKDQGEIETAHKLAAIYRLTLDIRTRVQDMPEAELDAHSKASMLFELDLKIDEFQAVLKELLGLDMIAFRTNSANPQGGGPFRGGSADEASRSVSPGEEFLVRVHTAQATGETRLNRVWLDSRSGDSWKSENTAGAVNSTAPVSDPIFRVHVAENAESTQPYFTRPSIEQPNYDLTNPEWRLRSFAPYPLSAWAEFTFDDLPIRVGQVVQTLQRVPSVGGIYEPLVVTPAIGVRMEPEARILPLDGSALPVRVTVHTQTAAEGTVALELPAGWTSQPAEAKFHTMSAGDTEPILFTVTTDGATTGAYNIEAVAHSGGHEYKTGWRSVGYPGLRPYNQYKPAQLKTRKVDLKLAPGLRIGYVMGTGDMVPEAIEGLGGAAHLLTAAELTTGDLSAWNVIVIGIRAYSARPELTAAQPRLDEFVRRGGTLIVQYQTGNFPAPFPLSMGRMAERVVDETAPVKLLDPANPLLRWPNVIGDADFDGWVEERGHSFLDNWDSHYTALTETADPGQDAQRGGLLVVHPGKGTYIYVAYALYRQLPELVPGAYRLLANLLSAGQENAASGEQTPASRP
jgi:LmbE family N-acetylglucosaminyl deacetylase